MWGNPIPNVLLKTMETVELSKQDMKTQPKLLHAVATVQS